MTRLALPQTALFLALSSVAGAGLLAGCVGAEADEQIPTNRHPLGKADSTGSCAQTDCDGPSEGSCWCDDLCVEFGDCCSDRVEVCEAPVSPICGGLAGFQCGEGEYCHYEEEAGCGFSDASGVCRPAPEACIELFAPVCGCNGNTYGNSCKAAEAGTSVAREGACAAESECEPILCELNCENGFEVGKDGCEVCSCAAE